MNSSATVIRTPSVVIERFYHPGGDRHRDLDSELTTQVAVSFVERGTFAIRQDGTSWSFGPSDVLVSVPGSVRQFRHSDERPDDVCLAVSFAPETLEDAVGDTRLVLPNPRVAGGSAPRFAHSLIRAAVNSRDDVLIEQAAFHCTLALSGRWRDRRHGGTASAAHGRRIRSAVELLSEHLADRCSLTSLAREVGMSPFHFARVFTELVGTSPHQYLLGLRLRHSATLLRGGAAVTEAALGSGFDNLSHFSRTFRRRFGVSPRRYASAPRLNFAR